MDDGRFKLDDFELYKLARLFRKRVYFLIHQLPPYEKYCLANQMRRAALSISNNVAEGHGRWHYLENIHYCRIARGSIDEVLDDLNTCLDEKYGDQGLVEALKEEGYALIHKTNGYIVYLRRSKQGEGTEPELRIALTTRHSPLATRHSPLTTHQP